MYVVSRWLLWLVVLAGALPSVNGATNYAVAVQANNRFNPAVLNIWPGDTVTWTWQESGHNIICDNPYDSGTRDPFCGNTAGAITTTYPNGNVLAFTYIKPGSYRYYCNPHQATGMTGVVHVASVPSAAVLTNFTLVSTQAQFKVNTTIYHTNFIQGSTNLTNWVTIGTNIPSTNSFLFTDQTAIPYRFYRVLQP